MSQSYEVILTQVQEGEGVPWFFLPGGPGMGSESLHDLILLLNLRNPLYQVDLPEICIDATNPANALEQWQQAILDVSAHFGQVVWLGHSFGGMLLQTIPELDAYLQGLVLANSAPDNTWFTSFAQRAAALKLPNVSQLRKNLLEHPSDDNYKSYMLNSIDYYFTPKGVTQGLSIFQQCHFQVKPYLWALEHFHPSYQALWIPDCPTLILSGELDPMTPATSFNQSPYQASQFQHKMIKQAGHFPWVEDPEEATLIFREFSLAF